MCVFRYSQDSEDYDLDIYPKRKFFVDGEQDVNAKRIKMDDEPQDGDDDASEKDSVDLNEMNRASSSETAKVT